MAMRLTDEQLEWLAARVPDASVSAKGGRPAMGQTHGVAWHLLGTRQRCQVEGPAASVGGQAFRAQVLHTLDARGCLREHHA